MPEIRPPELGRPSNAASSPWRLRSGAEATTAAYRADGGDRAGWALRVASVAGVRHRLAGQRVEDAWAWSDDDQLLIAAVADGVGSRPGSGTTAAAAAAAAVGNGIGGGESARVRVGQAVAAANMAAASTIGATTLVVVAAGADGHCCLARVGDSTAMRLDGSGWVEMFGTDADDGVATTATAALPAAVPAVEIVEVLLAPGELLVVVSDGIGDPLRDGPTTVAPAFAAALATPPSPLELAVLVDFSRQGCFDDRTLLGLWRTAGGGDDGRPGAG